MNFYLISEHRGLTNGVAARRNKETAARAMVVHQILGVRILILFRSEPSPKKWRVGHQLIRPQIFKIHHVERMYWFIKLSIQPEYCS
jgi:hypothetical protein